MQAPQAAQPSAGATDAPASDAYGASAEHILAATGPAQGETRHVHIDDSAARQVSGQTRVCPGAIRYCGASPEFAAAYKHASAHLAAYAIGAAAQVAGVAIIWGFGGRHLPWLYALPAAMFGTLLLALALAWWLVGPTLRLQRWYRPVLLVYVPIVFAFSFVPCFMAEQRMPLRSRFVFTAALWGWQAALNLRVVSVEAAGDGARTSRGAAALLAYIAADRAARVINTVSDTMFVNKLFQQMRPWY